MISRLLTPLRRWLVHRLAGLPDRRGVRMVIRLHDRTYGFMLQVIKVSERGYHPKHRVTDLHTFFQGAVEPGWKVLDVGCGYGHIAKSVASKAGTVTGVDIRPEAIARAQAQRPGPNIEYVAADFADFIDTRTFDLVIASNVLEHIKDRQSFLAKCRRLAPRIALRVPATDRDWLVPYKEELGLDGRLHPDHEIEYTEETLTDEVRRAGYRVTRIYEKFGAIHCLAEVA
jgi:SAM-dependent methyltransferase